MPAADPVKVGLSKDLIYFIFPDRYLNGDTSNDSFPGYNTRDTTFFYGGDLKGLTGTCSKGDIGLADYGLKVVKTLYGPDATGGSIKIDSDGATQGIWEVKS